ncbi:MAG: hypothetical protein NC039_04655 [Muribaculaceae bacterium]|nr:hypothetical protein [Muribaculaceae bacterium]
MKKILIMLCAAVGLFVASSQTSAQGLGIGNHLGLDLGVGTTGISVEASTPITQFVQARLGVSIMPGINFHVDSEVEFDTPMGTQYSDLDLDGSLKRVQGSLIFNVYPLGNRFPLFIAVGGYLGGKDVVGIKGYAPEAAGMNGFVEVGDYQLPLDATGHAKGALRVNNFRPYIGIGTGRPCPLGRVNFMWELGVQFQKKPYLYDDINKEKIDIASVMGEDDTFQKIMDKLTVYPVLKFTLSGRLF